jgi:glycerophosphoryl diester phosphodiesterase
VKTLGHRGKTSAAPENTMAAFRAAIAAGFDGFETDLRLASDGEVVLFHDRAVPGGRRVAGMTRAELSRAARVEVPSLEEVLDAFPHALLMLEVKAREAAGAVERALRRVLPREGLLVTSFHHDVAATLAEGLGVEGGAIVAHRPFAHDGLPRALRHVVWAFDAFDLEAARDSAARGRAHWVYGVDADDEEACRRLPLEGWIVDA